MTGDKVRQARAVEADDAAARPVADVGVGARPERVWAVEGLVREHELLPDPEQPRRRRRARLANPNRSAPHRAAVLEKPCSEPGTVDHEPRADPPELAQGSPDDPPRR